MLDIENSQSTNIRGPIGNAYRTRGQAGPVFPVARTAATITHPEYSKALTTVQGKSAFLQPTSSHEIQVDAGRLYIDGQQQPCDATQLTQYYIQGQLTEMDLPILNVIFSTLKAAIEQHPDIFIGQQGNGVYSVGVMRLYLPELMDALGVNAAKVNQSNIDAFVERLAAYNSVLGIIKDHRSNGGCSETAYPLMSLAAYDITNNTVSLASPYMVAIYERLAKPRYKLRKDGSKALDSNKEPITLPNYTSMIDSRLYGQKSYRAIFLVHEIVLLIIQSGSAGTPHITVRHLVERVPELAAILNDASIPSKDKSQTLARTFKTTWDYLGRYTLLRDKYKDIMFPQLIPRLRDLDKVLEFPHKGRVRAKG